MRSRIRASLESLYGRSLQAGLSETPSHIAVIQDGNRRFAKVRGKDPSKGHQAGAETTEQVLEWCDELGISEVTLYTFSTENFKRPPDEQEELFDLIERKLKEFADADRIHESEVRIRAIGETDRLPKRVQDAVEYADEQTKEYDNLVLNIALAYGGRTELLSAAKFIAKRVQEGKLKPEDITTTTIASALETKPRHDVDLIIRSGGDERTSNFLPWQANGNEAAVYFTAPYWPAFRKIDFLRGLRTYEQREHQRHISKLNRTRAILSAVAPKNTPNKPQENQPSTENTKVDTPRTGEMQSQTS